MQNTSDLTNVDQEYRLLFTLLAGFADLILKETSDQGNTFSIVWNK
ncbi:hypothetical protein LIT25_25010 [Bacillus sp. F19]|nr:hypothetical protein LIT25_25010 [Bacillus sp. F19]